MKTEKRIIGDIGEVATCKFLEKKGFAIRERNYLKPCGEIDIIVQKENVVHFIEVKTLKVDFDFVTHETIYRPEENVHEGKLKKIARTIQMYLLEHEEVHDWQFDVVSVLMDQEARKMRIRFLEDIVL